MTIGVILAEVLSIMSAVTVSVIVFYIQKSQKKRDKEMEAHAKAQRDNFMLSLEMNAAAADLSHAVACAIKRGSPNGEIEEGIKAYKAAKEKYYKFLNEQATQHLHE